MSATPRPFQIATVEAALAALSRDTGRRRFLVADEVGLGKTVVAREVVRRLSADGSKRLTVFYITNSSKVSDQNARRLLDFLGAQADVALSAVDRLGLIPLEAKPAAGLRLYALSPGTSFPPLTARAQGGKVGERAFIATLLERCYPGITAELPPRCMEYRATKSWKGALARAEAQDNGVPAKFVVAYRKALAAEFGVATRSAIVAASAAGRPIRFLSRLRRPLAEACLLATPPDLVIFDEFQRYRDLLRPSPDDRLVMALLNGSDDTGPATLMLSATPYRIYAERWEAEAGRQPHEELFEVLEFLGGAAIRGEAERLFERFGYILQQIGKTAGQLVDHAAFGEAEDVRTALQSLLLPLMSRTERHEAPKGLCQDIRYPEHALEPKDLEVFRHLAEGAPKALKSSAVSYWLSVPLPVQALGPRYKITHDGSFKPREGLPVLKPHGCYRRPKAGWGSAKLRALSKVASADLLALPWVAPSLPWWPMGGAWKGPSAPLKLLLFSRFRATPQSVAALTSLEVERRFVDASDSSYRKAWSRRRFQAKPTQGATLALFHPSKFLITSADPLKGRHATQAQARATVRRQIVAALHRAKISTAARSKTDAKRHRPGWEVLSAIERAAGIYDTSLVVHAHDKAWDWLARDDASLASLLVQRRTARTMAWISPSELDELVEMALAGPAVVVGRALLRHFSEALSDDKIRVLIEFCWLHLRQYLDNPVFKGRLGTGKPTRVVQNAVVDGGLETLLDEHFWLSKARVPPDALIDDLGKALAPSTGWFGFKALPATEGDIRIRCHAAVPFGGTEKSEDAKDAPEGQDRRPPRSEELRQAFNTPFWPHLLATTSVGQEGLDFHTWCERIAHWDLSSNPIDLEQREGRISRYGGLVVRRPLAVTVGQEALDIARLLGGSPWDRLAVIAEDRHGNASGLSPWWTLPGARISRFMFALPQSRDVARFRRLRRQRMLYRLALGQPNQEDLVDLLSHGNDEAVAALSQLTLDLSAFSRLRLDKA